VVWLMFGFELLCTLLLEQGWKDIVYAVASGALYSLLTFKKVFAGRFL
jgi:hypothetical protein